MECTFHDQKDIAQQESNPGDIMAGDSFATKKILPQAHRFRKDFNINELLI